MANLNVADDGTKWKGLPDLRPEARWFNSPSFLHLSECHWPQQLKSSNTANLVLVRVQCRTSSHPNLLYNSVPFPIGSRTKIRHEFAAENSAEDDDWWPSLQTRAVICRNIHSPPNSTGNILRRNRPAHKVKGKSAVIQNTFAKNKHASPKIAMAGPLRGVKNAWPHR